MMQQQGDKTFIQQVTPTIVSINCFQVPFSSENKEIVVKFLTQMKNVTGDIAFENIVNRFGGYKEVYSYKQVMNKIIVPFVKAVYSVSDIVVVGDYVVFYTLEEDGFLDLPYLDEFSQMFSHTQQAFNVTFG